MKKLLVFSMLCMLVAATAYAEGPKEVVRASFATGIENREPVESITEYFPVEGGTVFFFTELGNMQDTEVYHLWQRNGEELFKFTSNVKSQRWRTHSRMSAEHFKPGDTVVVKVMGDDGTEYKKLSLKIR